MCLLHISASHSEEGGSLEITENVFGAIEAAPERLAERMLAGIRAEIPSYDRAASPRLLDDVYDQCLQHARLMPRVLAEGRTPTRDELAFAREAARRRAHGGVPLDAFLHAFRVAHGVMWEAIAEDADADVALPLVGPLIEYIDIVCTQVAEAYVREEQRISALADRERRDLLENLIMGRLPETEERHRAAPGIDPTGALMVVIAQTSDVDALHHVAEALSATTRGHIGAALVVARQAEAVALVAAGDGVADDLASAESLLRQRHGLGLTAGVSSSVAGFAGVRRGYIHAEHAVRQATADRPIVPIAAIPAFEFLLMSADSATRSVVAAKGAALGSLNTAQREYVAETIAAFVAEDLNVARTAARLGLNENSVRYRLKRITELTGLDPRRFDHALELVCLMRVGAVTAAQATSRVS